MTDDQKKQEFANRLNRVCDDKQVPPKGRSRQTTVAKIFGVSQKGARKWLEAEGFPTIEMGIRIAAWGGVMFEWLMTGNGPKRLADLYRDHPLLSRYEAADPATRALIDLAMADAGAPVPSGLSPSVRAMVDMARAALREELKKPHDPRPE